MQSPGAGSLAKGSCTFECKLKVARYAELPCEPAHIGWRTHPGTRQGTPGSPPTHCGPAAVQGVSGTLYVYEIEVASPVPALLPPPLLNDNQRLGSMLNAFEVVDHMAQCARAHIRQGLWSQSVYITTFSSAVSMQQSHCKDLSVSRALCTATGRELKTSMCAKTAQT